MRVSERKRGVLSTRVDVRPLRRQPEHLQDIAGRTRGEERLCCVGVMDSAIWKMSGQKNECENEQNKSFKHLKRKRKKEKENYTIILFISDGVICE